jgi:putative transposase
MQDWSVRPLDAIYTAVFIDAIVVQVRDGQVANQPFYVAIGVSLAAWRDILALWAGSGGEGAKFWMAVLTDLKSRGVNDTFFVVCDGLRVCPKSCRMCGHRRSCRPASLDLIRNTFRLARRKSMGMRSNVISNLRVQRHRRAGRVRGVRREVGSALPAVIRLWDNAWTEFNSFLGTTSRSAP